MAAVMVHCILFMCFADDDDDILKKERERERERERAFKYHECL